MFQGLTQGATLFILYRNEPRLAEGRVVSSNTHPPQPNLQNPMAMFQGMVTDVTVTVGNDSIPFAGLPANGVVANFPDKGMFISTDRAAILREVQAMKSASEQVLGQIPAHQKMVQDCESLLIQYNPERKREIEQSQEIESLKKQIENMTGKFEQLMGALSANLGTKPVPTKRKED